MKIVKCPNCQIKVSPTQSGQCPSCRSNIGDQPELSVEDDAPSTDPNSKLVLDPSALNIKETMSLKNDYLSYIGDAMLYMWLGICIAAPISVIAYLSQNSYSSPIWILLGAGFGAAFGLYFSISNSLTARKRLFHDYQRKIWSQRNDFPYQHNIDRTELAAPHSFSIFENLTDITNYHQVCMRNTNVELFDLMEEIDCGEGDVALVTRTVAILKLSDLSTPNFELKPRNLSARMIPDYYAIKFRSTTNKKETAARKSFSKHYLLYGKTGPTTTTEHDGLLSVNSNDITGMPVLTDQHSKLKLMFDQPLLAYFAKNRNWQIESHAGYLALSRNSQTIPAENLFAFLDDVLDCAKQLDEAAKRNNALA